MEPKDWNELVELALKLESYLTLDDIKETLAKRFRHSNRVEGTVDDWWVYLKRLDYIIQRNGCVQEWSGLFRKAKEKGLEIKSIWLNAPVEEYKRKINELKERLENEKDV